MLLTGVVQNLGTGGTEDGDGRPDDRWPLLAERINSAADRVDFVMLCEVLDWHRYGHKQLARACEDLDLDVAPLAPSSSGWAPRCCTGGRFWAGGSATTRISQTRRCTGSR
ncbi:hypothetical protein PV416_02340 [Streptomyces ipomoeae]|uniref:hypothetical protein n=1 Tax=Streptomyces ipomoeae TaxID=103232 RepID=UPI0029AC85A8|nr:hypothetical protein [Streptomyces ipomoeae]MDX2819941.1 hypothetical protein [Streptomyces ipomoeae]MDX2872613.1 hypothetical protein [Streptomyces ipomoeae]